MSAGFVRRRRSFGRLGPSYAVTREIPVFDVELEKVEKKIRRNLLSVDPEGGGLGRSSVTRRPRDALTIAPGNSV